MVDRRPIAYDPDDALFGAERRAAVRYVCDLESSCRSITAAPGVDWPARLRDVSRGGFGIALARRFEPGTILSVDLHSSHDTILSTFLVRVTYVVEQGEKEWLLGCAFASKLSADDLRHLLVISSQ